MALIQMSGFDWRKEVNGDLVVLAYLPFVNPDSLVWISLQHGSFQVRDYLQSGSRPLKVTRGITFDDIVANASRYVIRVTDRPNAKQEGLWRELTRLANAEYLATARGSLRSANARSAEPRAPVQPWQRVAAWGPSYGLTNARAQRLDNRLRAHRDLYDTAGLGEDAAAILYFMLLDLGRQVRLGLVQRDDQDRWRCYTDIADEISRNSNYGETLLPQLTPFHGLDPLHHVVSFELQLNNNAAIGNPAAKTNQADVVIADVANKILYVVEAKLDSLIDDEQLRRSSAALAELTANIPGSPFAGLDGRLVVLDTRHRHLMMHGKRVDTLTWDQITQMLRQAQQLPALLAQLTDAEDDSQTRHVDGWSDAAPPPEPVTTGEVRLGSSVTIREDADPTSTYQIVGRAEAAPGEGRISKESALGKALLGKRVGETVTVQADEPYRVTIVHIDP